MTDIYIEKYKIVNVKNCTIITSETLLIDRTYIVTPTVTGEPETTKEENKRTEGKVI